MLDKIIKKLSYKISIVMYFYSPVVSEVFFFLPFELPGYIFYYHDYSSHNDSY